MHLQVCTACSLGLWSACREHESRALKRETFGHWPALTSCGPVPYSALGLWLTRCTPLVHLSFTRSNLLLAGGPRVPLDSL